MSAAARTEAYTGGTSRLGSEERRCSQSPAHLEEISSQVARGSIAALICDGAGWRQSGGELILPANIVLLPLPPYSPEAELDGERLGLPARQ